jgi:hypothetical protein
MSDMTVKWQKEINPVVTVRELAMSGAGPDAMIDGKIAWAWAMEKGSEQAVEMLMSLGADINCRDHMGRGFLLVGLDSGMPRWLLIHGLRRLDDQWWKPDGLGRSPFHHEKIDPVFAQAVALRAWTDQMDMSKILGLGDPVLMARERGQPDVARALAQWIACNG